MKATLFMFKVTKIEGCCSLTCERLVDPVCGSMIFVCKDYILYPLDL